MDSVVFDHFDGHEQVVFAADPASGLRCIVAIHSTALGPGLGGTRFKAYPTEEAALVDVLRLSRAMTYKNACAGLDHGGGKAVIIGDPAVLRSEALLRAYGRVIASLGGRYITACDIGTKPADMSVIRHETRWVTGMDPADGGSGDSGVLTAWGVYAGIKACLQHVSGDRSLAGRHVAVQGVGKVGRRLAEHLAADGARLTLADVDEPAVRDLAARLNAEVVPVEAVHRVDCDVFSPNALGAVLNDDTIPELSCRVVAGGANNQLAEERHAKLLHERGVLYAPDFVINAGGVIQISDELHPAGHSPERAKTKTETIADRLLEIFAHAEAEGIDTEQAANAVAEKRINAVGRLRSFWLSE
ncbi:MAG TPA: Glu/Leu/Phe/Val dehydrogenase dimerization domain-containing protein [Egibacteraceae bacterium]|nr:Glu/Leu/Phe/Val dehydrogenase dimerization domain-containing protein [Egibacteraceae bacterium]